MKDHPCSEACSTRTRNPSSTATTPTTASCTLLSSGAPPRHPTSCWPEQHRPAGHWDTCRSLGLHRLPSADHQLTQFFTRCLQASSHTGLCRPVSGRSLTWQRRMPLATIRIRKMNRKILLLDHQRFQVRTAITILSKSLSRRLLRQSIANDDNLHMMAWRHW